MAEGKKPAKAGKIIGLGCLGIVGVVVLLGVIGAIVGDKPGGADAGVTPASSPEAVAVATAPNVLTVTAAELSTAFQENEAKAKLAYDGKTLRVSGVVKDITLDFADDPVIALAGAGEQYHAGISKDGKLTDVAINGLGKEVAAEITKGSSMTFDCASVDEMMGSPQLGGCKVVS